LALYKSPGKKNKRCLIFYFKMTKLKKNEGFYEREKKLRRVEKGTSKIDKHRKIIYNVASLQKDDDVFDELLDYAYANQKIKRR